MPKFDSVAQILSTLGNITRYNTAQYCKSLGDFHFVLALEGQKIWYKCRRIIGAEGRRNLDHHTYNSTLGCDPSLSSMSCPTDGWTCIVLPQLQRLPLLLGLPHSDFRSNCTTERRCHFPPWPQSLLAHVLLLRLLSGVGKGASTPPLLLRNNPWLVVFAPALLGNDDACSFGRQSLTLPVLSILSGGRPRAPRGEPRRLEVTEKARGPGSRCLGRASACGPDHALLAGLLAMASSENTVTASAVHGGPIRRSMRFASR